MPAPRAGGGDPGSPSKADAERGGALGLRDPLLVLTALGVVVGALAGTLLRLAGLGPAGAALVGFPGELMLRLLKMLVLPLVSLSVCGSVCALGRRGGAGHVARLARLTAAWYAATTAAAVAIGLVAVLTIRPGRAAAGVGAACGAAEGLVPSGAAAAAAGAPPSGALDALLRVSRLLVPDNVARAAVDMNVLGLITFSLLLGWALASLGAAGAPAVDAVLALNAAVGKMVGLALWAAPVGVASLIASAVLTACDLGATLGSLGLWVATVVVGLAAFAGLVLPALLVAATGRSPLGVARQFAQPLLVAFGTSSSAAALPLAMDAARAGGAEPATVAFFLPMGVAVNLSGTALYEAVTAIFIAQAHGVALSPAELVVVALTASLAAVGAPAIPSAGLVTMLIVLQAVGLDRFSGDLAAVLAVDFALDRCRTAVNLLGDAYGVVAVDAALQRGKGGRPGGGGGGEYAQVELGEL